jgi:cytidine deaminase
MLYKNKYIIYKNKYLNLKKLMIAGYDDSILNPNITDKLNELDKELIEKVNEFIKINGSEDHLLATGIMHKTGHVVYGLSARNPLGNEIHGEHSVISQAHIFDNNRENFIAIVSMTKSKDSMDYKIKAPCGMCRELLRYYYPNMYSIVRSHNSNDIIKVINKYLLPYPYVSTKLPDASKLNENINIVYQKNKM